MKLVISEKQLKAIVSQLNKTQDLTEEGEGEGAPESGTSSDGEKKTGASKWESGVTRGPGNQIGVTKWADSYKITRGRANPLSEQDTSNLVQILRPDGKVMYAPANTQILGVFTQEQMGGEKFKDSIKIFLSKERGGLGNRQTDAWIPSDWSKMIKLNSVSGFKTPDNIIYKSVLKHPTLENLRKKGGTWNQFYTLDPEPYGWKFVGYFSDETKKSFVGVVPEKSFWDEWKYVMLAGASIIAVIAFPGIGGILFSIGIDLFSAGLQYIEGDTIGAGVSTILAFIPVIGRVIPALKVADDVALKLAKEFAPLTDEVAILNKVKSLPQQERYFMQKLLAEDPKKLTALIEKEIVSHVNQKNAGEVVSKLNELIKNKTLDKVKATTLYNSLTLRRFGFDLTASGLILYGEMKYKDFLNNKAQEQVMNGVAPDEEDIIIAKLAKKVKDGDPATYSMTILPIIDQYRERYDVDDENLLNKLRKIQKGLFEAYLKDPNSDFEVIAKELDK
jgi:hypothetical protein